MTLAKQHQRHAATADHWPDAQARRDHRLAVDRLLRQHLTRAIRCAARERREDHAEQERAAKGGLSGKLGRLGQRFRRKR